MAIYPHIWGFGDGLTGGQILFRGWAGLAGPAGTVYRRSSGTARATITAAAQARTSVIASARANPTIRANARADAWQT